VIISPRRCRSTKTGRWGDISHPAGPGFWALYHSRGSSCCQMFQRKM